MSLDALAEFPQKRAEAEQFADIAFREKIEEKIKESASAIYLWEEKARNEDRGLREKREKWFSPNFDDSDWQTITAPAAFSESGLPDFCGVLWLRKYIEISDELDFFIEKKAEIWLGTITDADTVYINGVEIGKTAYRYPPRKYTIPENCLHKGKNLIALRIVCNNGEGGITRDKPFYIFSRGKEGESDKIRLDGVWKRKIGVSLEPRPPDFFVQWKPTGLFNAMIAPLSRYPVRGVIWYQGESNTDAPDKYEAMFAAMIQDWRKRFSPHELPFLFVQLPLFGEPSEDDAASKWAAVREAQAQTLSLPQTGMATALDLGEWNDLHPLNKKEIGRRLALAAGKLLYNEKNSAPGPLLKNIERQGNTLTLTFDNCGAGLVSHGDLALSIIAKGEKTRISAFIKDKNQLEIDISSISFPDFSLLLYAWADNPCGGLLYNSEGLPAIPFRAEREN